MVSLTWKRVLGSQEEKPLSTEITTNTVYLRKNIERTTVHVAEDDVEMWAYDEVALTPEEYENYLNVVQNPTTVEIMQQLSDMQSNLELQSVISDANTQTIMQAINDLQADVAAINL